MDSGYTEKLEELRWAFGPISEASLLTDIIARYAAPRTSITMLDVGIGNGIWAQKVVAGVQARGVRVAVTGLDPYIPESAQELDWEIRPTFIAAPLASYLNAGTFDVVNATHSLYYLGDEGEALRRLLSLVSPGGILIATIWADGCALKAVHDGYLAVGRPSPSQQNVGATLRALVAPRGSVEKHYFEGTVALGEGGRAHRTKQAIIDIARRDVPVSDAARSSALDFLDSLGTVAARRNAIFVAAP